MADFTPPFAQNGERRFPTAEELSLGFPCGPADQRLFNQLFHLLYGNVGDVITEAGVSPNFEGDLTTLKRAILALIAAALAALGDGEEGEGGEGFPAFDTSAFVLMSQARSRLLFFPEIQTATYLITPTVPTTGQILVPGGVTFLHRGIFPISTSDFTSGERTFNTDPNKIYHLRWRKDTGLALEDLASIAYNPTSAAETSAIFDTTYDDMLIARVVTNGSNVATITPLKNKHDLSENKIWAGTPTAASGKNAARAIWTTTFNLSRTPHVMPTRRFSYGRVMPSDSDLRIHPHSNTVMTVDWGATDYMNRYGMQVSVMVDHAQGWEIDFFLKV